MNIHEHQAKDILKEFKAPVSEGIVIFSKSEIKEKISKLKIKNMFSKLKSMLAGEEKLEVLN